MQADSVSPKLVAKTVLDAVWYLVNSHEFTLDMGGFKADPKKVVRILSGNLFEYFFVNVLRAAKLEVKHDKDDPFVEDDGLDIVVGGVMNVHAKASTHPKMLGQVRNGKVLVAEMKSTGGYVMVGFVPRNDVEDVNARFLSPYVEKYGFVKSKDGFVSKRELFERSQALGIDLMSFKPKIRIDGFVPIVDYFKTAKFVKAGETIPGTKFIQNFEEGSFFYDAESCAKVLRNFKEAYAESKASNENPPNAEVATS